MKHPQSFDDLMAENRRLADSHAAYRFIGIIGWMGFILVSLILIFRSCP